MGHHVWKRNHTARLKDIPCLEKGWPYKMLTTIQMKQTKRSSLASVRAGPDPTTSGKSLKMQFVHWELGI